MLLRLYALPHVPVGLHYDEAANVILSRQIASGSYHPLFIRAYTGKEVLFFYAVAPWLKIVGSAWGIRLGAAMLGVLTVAATYRVTRELLGAGRRSRCTAILASALLAVSFPHVLLSRYGFRAISQPLLQALTVGAIWHGWRTRRIRWLAAGGVFLGLTGYTYLAARLFPIPILVAFTVLLLTTPHRERPRQLREIGIILAAASVTFAPLGFYFLRHPETFSTRVQQVAAPSWQVAWHGVTLCAQALVVPGAGDPYIRFNIPGQPLLTPVSALLAAVGLLWFLLPRRDGVEHATRVFLLTVIPVMLLPSALATSAITPSNLRMVGLYPFLVIFPALGVTQLLRYLPHETVLKMIVAMLLLVGGKVCGESYLHWGTSSDLFYAADGEMVLAAQALDEASPTTTVYIASQHYRHPTVAALSSRYKQAKWLTGGATLVYPAQGDALYLWPTTLTPPAPWPTPVTALWAKSYRDDPAGHTALTEYTLTEVQIAALRPKHPASDFAHVIKLYDARPITTCHSGGTCPIQLTWEVQAHYPSLQPIIRLIEPRTGEWARVSAFHYPPEMWSVGDVLWDQYLLTLPAGIPPGDSYRLAVSFYDDQLHTSLPRLKDEQFAGLEVAFPLQIAPRETTLSREARRSFCADLRRPERCVPSGLCLVGWGAGTELRAGEVLPLTLCWSSPNYPLPDVPLSITLHGPQQIKLYSGPPANGYDFSAWPNNSLIEDREPIRLPRTLPSGRYKIRLHLGHITLGTLTTITVTQPTRIFTPSKITHPLTLDFGNEIQLLGYTRGTLQAGQPFTVTWIWQALTETEKDYTVFVHLVDATGKILAQVDEGPRHSTYPTSLWVAGEIVYDEHTLNVPNTLPPGPYKLQVGFYRQDTGERLLNAGRPYAEVELP